MIATAGITHHQAPKLAPHLKDAPKPEADPHWHAEAGGQNTLEQDFAA